MKTVSCRRFIHEAKVHCKVSLCGIYVDKVARAGFSPIASVFPCQDHSVNASYAFALHNT